MNLPSATVGGLTSGLAGLPLTAAIGSPVALLFNSGSGGDASVVPNRDTAMASLSDSSSLVNVLQQFAGSPASATSSDPSAEPELSLPPLPQTPAPKPAAAVPRDDHGQSNVVFSDGDAGDDPALIH